MPCTGFLLAEGFGEVSPVTAACAAGWWWWCQYSRTINYGFILFSGNPARDRLVNKLGWTQGY